MMIRVLLVDDEAFYYKLVAPVIRKAGYDLEYARNGNEGLTKLPIYNPDIVVLDLRLPDLTGFDILARIRRDPHFSNVPVIFVTGQNELNSKLKAFELGADDYLEKPFQPEELVARLGILARRSKAMKMAQQYGAEIEETTTTVAVHSLRGGVGCSSIAVNLALAFHQGKISVTMTTKRVAVDRYFDGLLLKNGFRLRITRTINDADTTDSRNQPVLN